MKKEPVMSEVDIHLRDRAQDKELIDQSTLYADAETFQKVMDLDGPARDVCRNRWDEAPLKIKNVLKT